MIRFFLTNPPLNMAEAPLNYHRPLIPLGLGYLGGVVENAFSGGALERFVRNYPGTSTRYKPSGRVAAQDNMFLSFYGRFDLSALIARMSAFFEGSPADDAFIGVSVLSDGRRAAREMLRAIRASLPQATIIVGGPHATFMPSDFYEDPDTRSGPLADYVVRNEGESVIVPILNRQLDSEADLQSSARQLGVLLQGSDYSDPRYRIIDGGQFGVATAGWGAHVLDALPVPAYFLFEDETGALPYEPDRRYELTAPAANINSSRGCPHHCTFCAIPRLAPGYRTLSPRRMMAITRFLVHYYGLSSLFFREDNFMYSGGSISGDRWPDIRSFCEQMVDEKLNVRWAIEARADNLLECSGDHSRDRLDIMKSAGLSGVYVGVESGSDVILKRLVKGSTVNQMSAALTACKDKGVAVVATSLYQDPDLLQRSEYPTIDVYDPNYVASIIRQREEILSSTRAFIAAHDLPPDRREEYAMVGVPVSTTYLLLDEARRKFPQLVEHLDPESRYIYPKGFRWWSDAVYKAKHRVRPSISYEHSEVP